MYSYLVIFILRCMDLPPGVFELIADMLPMPRVWQWSILRLKKRCKLAPHQAVCDINTIMDEILTDACLFAGHQQSLLVRINQNSQVLTCLVQSRTWYKFYRTRGLKDPLQCLSVCLSSVCLSSAYLSVCLPSACLSSICLSVFCLPVCLLSACLSPACLCSVCPFSYPLTSPSSNHWI